MPTTTVTKTMSLGIGSGYLGLDQELRTAFTEEIDRQFNVVNNEKRDVWTGDLNYFSTLHKDKLFQPLFSSLNTCVPDYCKQIGTNPDFFDYYVVRSWGTKSLKDQSLPAHGHKYASISVVYYPSVPKDSGNFVLGVENELNELIPDLMSDESYADKILDPQNEYSARGLQITPEDDLYLIFPAKTMHCTTPNFSDKPRYSIAIDILMTLKETKNIEYALPPIKNWSPL
jgi:hypothetical protein